MIAPLSHRRVYLATKPVDFRKGMDGLASLVMSEFDLDPFSGAIFVFRSKRSDRLKMIIWDGTGLVLIYKRLEGRGFTWPIIKDGVVSLSKTQFEALFEGIDWRRVQTRRERTPQMA